MHRLPILVPGHTWSCSPSSSISSTPCSSPPFKKILVANRGEIAIRIFAACKALGVATAAVYSEADRKSLHVQRADEAYLLAHPPNEPITPYLNIPQVIQTAVSIGADAIHPGYGFLSEVSAFAAACAERAITFIGPSPHSLLLFGNKTSAKQLAREQAVPVARGSPVVASAEEALAFLKTEGIGFPVLIKAALGGGGKGQRLAKDAQELRKGFSPCSQEAALSFGDGSCFVEEFLEDARHIEVQILGDAAGSHVTLEERDCSIQFRNQKVVEVAPPRDICPQLRAALQNAALKLAKAAQYVNAGTVEFLVQGTLADPSGRFIFLEMNPRIQVEHTITEEICGVDLVKAQIRLAARQLLADMNLSQQQIQAKGFAIQLRLGLIPGKEVALTEYEEPTGEGIRVDSSVAKGFSPSQQFDPLLAKLVVSVPAGSSFQDCTAKALKALSAYRLNPELKTNRHILANILKHPLFVRNQVTTTFMTTHQKELFSSKDVQGAYTGSGDRSGRSRQAGMGRQEKERLVVRAPFPGKVVEIKANPDQAQVRAGDAVLLLSAMKMLTEVASPLTGSVSQLQVAVGQQVNSDDPLFTVEGYREPDEATAGHSDTQNEPAAESVEAKLGLAQSLHTEAWYLQPSGPRYRTCPRSSTRLRSALKTDSAQFQARRRHNLSLLDTLNQRLKTVQQGGSKRAVALHRKRGKKLPRERIAAIIDPGTRFLELSALAAWGMYGGNIHSASMICGIGVVAGVECMFLCNDATVKGGVFFPETAKKQLRAQRIAQENRLPCIYLVDGGGANLGGGVGSMSGAGEEQSAAVFVSGGLQFKNQAVMSSMRIPQIAAVLGKCTAGGAYIPAMADESIIVKGNGTIYLGGPPLVKAATGEEADEQELGGAAMHCSKSGVTDHFAETEDEALRLVRAAVESLARPARFLLPTTAPQPPAYDPEELLGLIPEDNKFPYDVREVIARVVDSSRFHEFKPRFGCTLVCGFAYLHGFPVGILGNNGMLFSDSAIKGAHFIQICGQRKIPLVFFHNITGFMVGTEYEQGGITKHGAKMIMAVSCVAVPKISIVLGGSHGAGNYAMCGPAFDPRFTFLWPNARISVMGGQQAADVITIVKDAQLKREGKALLSAEGKKAMQAPIIEALDGCSSAYDSTKAVFDDGIIDPRDTRAVLGMCISISLNGPFPESGYGVFRM
eukprot:g34696.t1